MPKVLIAPTIFTGSETRGPSAISVDDTGLVSAIETATAGKGPTTLAPAFLDIHTHGALGHDVMSATPADLSAMQRFLAQCGVAYYLPTTVTASIDTTLRALEHLADAVELGPQPLEAQPIGIHLEGPFLSHAKRGVHPTQHLLKPSIALFDRFQQAARGHILLITLAPELPGALDLTAHATAQGVRVSMGHTNATAPESLAAIEAGALSGTHTFNAMRPLDHREPGVLGTVLTDDRLYSELICDGVHVAPAMVRLWLKSKGPGRAILVTDAMAAAGSGNGNFTLGGLPVTVANGRALLTEDLAHGKETLAGSVLTMDQAVANLQQFTGADLLTAVRLATQIPATLLGRPELATIAPGHPANLNRFNANGHLIATYIRGEQVQKSP